MDAFARQGVRYDNAFAPIGVCAPARSSLILGTHAPSAGTQHMRSRVSIPSRLRMYSQELRRAGYYATNNDKEDYNFYAPKDAWDASGGKAHWRNRPDKNQPFFAVFNFNRTHEQFVHKSDAEFKAPEAHSQPSPDPALAPIPPYHPDLPGCAKIGHGTLTW